jgi:hypothetical protein
MIDQERALENVGHLAIMHQDVDKVLREQCATLAALKSTEVLEASELSSFNLVNAISCTLLSNTCSGLIANTLSLSYCG